MGRNRSLDRRLNALELRSGVRPIFVQFAHDRPGQPRQLADGQVVTDAAVFAQRLASAGPAAVLIKVEYGTTR